MQPVLNLWRKGASPPAGWTGQAMALGSWVATEQLLGQIAAWAEAHPLGWLTASGPAVALLIKVASERLDLRIAGAALVSPQDWPGLRGGVVLSEAPLPFPSVLFSEGAGGSAVPLRERQLAAAWHARAGGLLPEGGPLNSPVMQAMMAERMTRLTPLFQAADSVGWAIKADRDLESSTAAIASRTSSMVRRTVQVASSTQSTQGT